MSEKITKPIEENMTEATLRQKMVEVQSLLRAPKDLENKFGGYKYRSAESILEAVKPLLHERGMSIVITDQIINLGNRFYVEAKVCVLDGKDILETKALARESETKKGMDESQITGAASSYARKYALNGMFAIDDTKDADATNDHGKGPKKEGPAADMTEEDYPPTMQFKHYDEAMAALSNAVDLDDVQKFWNDKGRRIANGLKQTNTKLFNQLVAKKDELKQHFEGKK